MKTLILGEGVDATAVAAQTAVHPTATPFLGGRDVVCDVQLTGVTGAPTIKVQGSSDNSAWTDLISHTVLYSKKYNIKAYPYMRLNVTVAGTAGTVSAYCQNGA
jgi:hypothetical protein